MLSRRNFLASLAGAVACLPILARFRKATTEPERVNNILLYDDAGIEPTPPDWGWHKYPSRKDAARPDGDYLAGRLGWWQPTENGWVRTLGPHEVRGYCIRWSDL